MYDIRCDCGKIVCQSEEQYVVIKCRHCKRVMVIRMDDYYQKGMITPYSLDILTESQKFCSKLHN